MTTPEQSEPQQFNEPEYLETEGYLNRALRRLGEGLGPFVYGKVQDKKLLINDGRSIVTRDLSIIFGIMEVNWNRLDLAYDDWNCMGLLIGFRNVSWAHFAGYKDDDVLHYLGIIRRLLDAVSAAQQAQEVQRMWDELVNLIASPVAPERLQGARGESLQQQVADLQELLETLVEQGKQICRSDGQRSSVMLHRDYSSDSNTPSLASSITPGSGEDFLGLAEEAFKQQYFDFDSVITASTHAIQDNRHLELAYRVRGWAYLNKAKVSMEEVEFDSIVALADAEKCAEEQYKLAADDYKAALGLQPGYWTAMFLSSSLAHLYSEELENYKLVVEVCDAALKREQDEGDGIDTDDPLQSLGRRETYADLYGMRGHAYFHLERYESAIADYNRYLEFFPDMLDMSGEVVLDMRDVAVRILNGAVDYDRSVDRNPVNPEAYHLRALDSYDREEYWRAIEDLTIAITLAADDDLKAAILDLLRRKNDGLDLPTLGEVDRLASGNDLKASILRNLVYRFLDRDDVLSDAEVIEAINLPDDYKAEIFNERGRAYWYLEKNDQSYEDYNQAIKLKQDFPEAWYNCALVWRRRGEHRNAIIDFGQAIAHKPDYALAYHHRGQSHLFAGDQDKAQADFKMAVSLGYEP